MSESAECTFIPRSQTTHSSQPTAEPGTSSSSKLVVEWRDGRRIGLGVGPARVGVHTSAPRVFGASFECAFASSESLWTRLPACDDPTRASATRASLVGRRWESWRARSGRLTTVDGVARVRRATRDEDGGRGPRPGDAHDRGFDPRAFPSLVRLERVPRRRRRPPRHLPRRIRWRRRGVPHPTRPRGPRRRARALTLARRRPPRDRRRHPSRAPRRRRPFGRRRARSRARARDPRRVRRAKRRLPPAARRLANPRRPETTQDAPHTRLSLPRLRPSPSPPARRHHPARREGRRHPRRVRARRVEVEVAEPNSRRRDRPRSSSPTPPRRTRASLSSNPISTRCARRLFGNVRRFATSPSACVAAPRRTSRRRAREVRRAGSSARGGARRGAGGVRGGGGALRGASGGRARAVRGGCAARAGGGGG